MWPLVLKTWRLAVLSVKGWTKSKLTNAGGRINQDGRNALRNSQLTALEGLFIGSHTTKV